MTRSPERRDPKGPLVLLRRIGVLSGLGMSRVLYVRQCEVPYLFIGIGLVSPYPLGSCEQR